MAAHGLKGMQSRVAVAKQTRVMMKTLLEKSRRCLKAKELEWWELFEKLAWRKDAILQVS